MTSPHERVVQLLGSLVTSNQITQEVYQKRLQQEIDRTHNEYGIQNRSVGFKELIITNNEFFFDNLKL